MKKLKKYEDYDQIILYVKCIEKQDIVSIHTYKANRWKVKEVYFRQGFFKWLKTKGITQFSKKAFNDYCRDTYAVDLEYRGGGRFVFREDLVK